MSSGCSSTTHARRDESDGDCSVELAARGERGLQPQPRCDRVTSGGFDEALARLRREPPARLGVVRPASTARRRLKRRFSDVLIVRVDVPGRSFDLFLKRARIGGVWIRRRSSAGIWSASSTR